MIATLIMHAAGISSMAAYAVMASVMLFIQYMIGPWLIGLTMGVKYVKRQDYPWLFEMVEDLARKAKIPTPKIGISSMPVPNAFAFGRGARDGRVCVTAGIINLVNKEELRAVLGHEMSHLKNRDVLFITLLSVIPMILWYIARQFMFYGGGRRNRDSGNYTVLIGAAALIFYFITNLLVLYASRIREYFADKGSVELGNQPAALASALYKLVAGSASLSGAEVKAAAGARAFFLNDPTRARREIRTLAQLDPGHSGVITMEALRSLRSKEIKLGFGDMLWEGFGTHPNMLKRIKHLSQL
jgi:heat shock protein HtpX